MHTAVSVRVLVVVAAVVLLWTLSLLVGSQEDTTIISAPVDKVPASLASAPTDTAPVAPAPVEQPPPKGH